MPRPLPPPALSRGGTMLDPAAEPPRCPRCGSGELLSLAIGRRSGEAWQTEFCGGLYDRERRRIIMRSCGYSGEAFAGTPAPSAPSACPDR